MNAATAVIDHARITRDGINANVKDNVMCNAVLLKEEQNNEDLLERPRTLERVNGCRGTNKQTEAS